MLRYGQMSDVDELKKAKECSDNRQYSSKHQIIKQMMMDDPGAFFIDSDDGRGIVGITHKKTGFRFHMPIGKIRPGLEKEAGLGTTLGKQLGKINLGEYGTKAVEEIKDKVTK
jgi:hypothetical protein